ncbi:MAG: histidinol-phosphate transaminase [Desulfobacterales bacterium]|nr:histidinol-phosphate transaminase [Desulfobacterales bacterium]MDD4070748.1 histidinol-phosphate transaminase [Desulfobacterales bacterium]MDD4391150.1 histidinol-phosphate transaminase [Desulfobacterales bacterium]
MKTHINDYILKIKPYLPGKPMEELEREYGIARSIKLASNENPLGPAPKALAAIEKSLSRLNRYPDGSCYDLIHTLSQRLNTSHQQIVLGNGSDEIITMLSKLLLSPGCEAIIPQPSFLIYDIAVRCCGATSVYVPLKGFSICLKDIERRISSKTRMIFLCNPNNPTGTIIRKSDFDDFLAAVPPGVVIVIDEAYVEFVRDPQCLSGIDYLDSGKNIVVLRTFSKVYGLAGLRIGYGVMPEQLAELVNRIRLPFNVNSLGQVAAMAALEDKEFFEKTLRLVHGELDFLYASLDKAGVDYFPSQTNFFLIDVRKNADEVYEQLLRHGVIVRSMASYGYPEYIRVTVGLHEENVRFIRALEKVMS